MALVLAINTSEKRGEVLLADADSMETIVSSTWSSESSHSETLAPALQNLLDTAPARSLSMVKSIFVIEGPGSFTGLRVGVNFAKTLAYANQIPIYGINTLKALAISGLDKKFSKIFTTIDAQKNSLFFSEFNFDGISLDAVTENKKVSASEFENHAKPGSAIAGSGWGKYQSLWNQNFIGSVKTLNHQIDLSSVLNYQKTFKAFSSSSWNDIQPRYFKKSTPEELMEKSRQRS